MGETSRRRPGVQGIMVGRYLMGEVVGKGVSSEVRLATDTANDELVALKIMLKEWIWKNDMSSLVRREIGIMKELDHPCVVKLVEVFNSETHVFMAMEAIEGRELRTELRREGYLSEERSRNIFQQLENVLLSEDGERIKLTDFELATHLDEWEGGSFQEGRKSWRARKSHRRQQSAGRTPAYAAPEVIAATEDHRYDARGVDTWCAGLCLFALVTGRLPFRAKGSEATLGIIQTMEPTYPEGLPPLLTDLLRGMLRKDPSKRLSVPAVMGHPWTSARLNTCVDLEEQTHLARMAVQEAKIAALEAERKAAFALAAQNSAALALAATGDASSAVEPPPAATAAAQGEEDKHDGRGIPRSRSGSGNRSLGGQTGGPAVASKAPGGEEEAAAAARTSSSSSSANQGGGRNFARLLRRRASMEETGRGGGGGKPPAQEKQAGPSSQRGRGGGTGGGGGGGGGGGPAMQRPASVDYRRDDVTLGPRQDNEWMTPPRDSSYPAVGSSLGRPEPPGGESGVAAGGGAGDECGRGPVVAGSVFAGTAESAAAAAAAATATGSGAVARRKMLRRSQSAVPSKGPVTNGTRGAAAEIAAAATVPEEAVGKGPSSSSSSSTSAAASNLVKQGSRSGIGKRGGSIRSKIRRSLSSVFGPTSSTSSSPPPDPAPVPVPLPPPIEHSTSLDSVLAPGAAKTPRAGASGGVSAVPPAINRCASFDLVVPAASTSTAAAAAAAASTSASFSSGAVSTPPPSQQPRADEKSLNAGTADGQAAAMPEAVAVANKEEAALQQPSALSRFLASTQREKKKMAQSVTPEPEPEPPAAAAATVAVATGDGGGGSGGGSADGLLPGERRQERPRSSSLTRAPPSDPTQGKSPPAGGARAVSGAAAEASVSAEAAAAAAAAAAEGGPWGENGAPGKMDGLDVSAGAPAAGTSGDLAATDTASAGSSPSHSVTAAAAAANSAKTRPLPGLQEGVRPAAGAPAATESLGEDNANSVVERWSRRIVATSSAAEAEQPTVPQEVTASAAEQPTVPQAATSEDSQQAVPLAAESGLMSEPKNVGASVTDDAPVSESAGANTPAAADEASAAMASLLEDGYPPGLPLAPAGPGALPIVLEGSACEATAPALGAHAADGSPPQLAGGSFSSAAHRRAPANNPKASYLRSDSEVSEATSAYEDPANEFDEVTRAVLARVDDLEEGDEPTGLMSAAAVGVALPSPDGERPLAGLSVLSRMGGAAAAEEEAEEPAGQGLPVDLPPTTPDGEETLAGLSILYADEKVKLAAAAVGAIDGVSALDNFAEEDNDVTASEESKAGEETPAVEKKPAAAAAEAEAASTDPVLEARSGGAEAIPDRRLLCRDGAQEEETPSTAVNGEGPVSGTEKMEEGGTAAEDVAGVPFASGGVVDTPLGNENPGILDEGAPADDASVAESRQADTDSPVEASSDKDHPQLKKSSSLPTYDEVVSYSGSWEEGGDTAVDVTGSVGQEEGCRDEVGGGGGGDDEGGDGEGCADNRQDVTGPELDDGGGDGSSGEKLAETGAGAETGEEGSIAAARDDVSVSTSTTATARSTSVQREATASGDDVPHTPMTAAATTAAATAVRVAPGQHRQQQKGTAGTRRSSPTREAEIPREPIDPSGGPTAVRITGSSQPSPSPVAPGRIGGGSGGSVGGIVTPQGFQPSTFKEMMTGVRDTPTAEKGYGSAAWDSPSQSRADGDGGGGGGEEEEEEEEAAAPRHGGGVVVQYKGGSSNAVTVRKMAELESIWGSAAAAGASDEDDGNDWRRASGRYRRINGEYRPPKTAASNMTTTNKTTTNALYGGAGGPLGQPAWSLDGTADKAATMAAALSGAGEDSKGATAPGKRQQKRGKSVGKKIYRMFGRKTEAK
ncbi:conserved unknown protein [Ectocarpus siliculosus]|uniref:Protein kinase domain-containing protein n=1 Tax=Ectocarpus siliculosus TaxID=2880 RepID=D7FSU0_ECTSI|nr:conserved unknown protein [Ectocarpus siliculosus]|eukprot:CBJ31231.1 conserved unknown protein [Ectocarpus siliculosus]